MTCGTAEPAARADEVWQYSHCPRASKGIQRRPKASKGLAFEPCGLKSPTTSRPLWLGASPSRTPLPLPTPLPPRNKKQKEHAQPMETQDWSSEFCSTVADCEVLESLRPWSFLSLFALIAAVPRIHSSDLVLCCLGWKKADAYQVIRSWKLNYWVLLQAGLESMPSVNEFCHMPL